LGGHGWGEPYLFKSHEEQVRKAFTLKKGITSSKEKKLQYRHGKFKTDPYYSRELKAGMKREGKTLNTNDPRKTKGDKKRPHEGTPGEAPVPVTSE